MRVATQGAGPLVLLCHGFPELWCSWRAQMAALVTALESQGITTFYMQYFQTPGVAEAELEVEVVVPLARVFSFHGPTGDR